SAENTLEGWEKYSLPLGNGYFGMSIFGGTDVERLQFTTNVFANTYKQMYAMMEKYKRSAITFEELLKEFYFKTNRVEASFISKLLHTIDNNMPIWDKFVLQNLCKKMQMCHGEEKLNAAINIYEEIVAWYKAALKDERIKKKLADFDKALPQYSWFSETKKLDFLLWQMR
ncbi:MAG: hypothetical protein IJY63_00405, partial [Clostridia bacterium]|nr:hypothetical protein [Clostridia bacterium]